MKIRIVGNWGKDQVIELIQRFFGDSGKKFQIFDENSKESKVDILLIIDSVLAKTSIDLEKEAFVILNMDEKLDSKLVLDGHVKLITYGFNNKASITASSVSESKTQFCIQRSIPTFSGRVIVEQEFSIELGSELYDIRNILAAVTVSLISDVLI